MRYTKVKQVMSSPVVTARQSTPYRELVELLDANRISFLPIVDDDGHVVGVVSETDLLFKGANPHADAQRPLLERRRHQIQRVKAVGTTAAELMTTPVETIESWASTLRAAAVMQDRQVKHLVVADKAGTPVGVVSRGDLLRVFLRSDDAIKREISQDVLRDELALHPWDFQLEVHDGAVTLRGVVERRGEVAVVISAVQSVEGVTHLDSDLRWKIDDVTYQGHSPYIMAGP